MMVSIQSYVRQGHRLLRCLYEDSRIQAILQGVFYTVAGMALSGASLAGQSQTLCLGFLCGAPAGWPVLLAALGSAGGYLMFWGNAGRQGVAWVCCGLMAVALLGGRRISRRVPLLLPAVALLIAAGTGVAFQVWVADGTSVPMYLLRVFLAGGSARLFAMAFERREPMIDQMVAALAVLSLSQISLTPWLGLGYVAAAALCIGAPLSTVALAGLAVDLAQITPVSMTAVLCASALLREIPHISRRLRWMLPGICYLTASSLCSVGAMYPLPGLLLGGGIGLLLPISMPCLQRRGEAGLAQVRLEMVAGVLAQTERALLETQEREIDEQTLVAQAAERTCAACACRGNCPDRIHMLALPGELLHRSDLQEKDVPIPCRRVNRMVPELQRAKVQLRHIRAERARQRECREAVIQQHQFLADYLRQLSDGLTQTAEQVQLRFRPEVAAFSASREQANGDRCVWFSGTAGRFYVLLCDGMGTGLGAARETAAAIGMLRPLLEAGFPPEHALRSLNSLCVLREYGGNVTIDLAQIRLDTGSAVLYKWGAAPSYVLTRQGAEKIGTAGPPPGLSITDERETVCRLSLRRGETLILLSDGAEGEEIRTTVEAWWREPVGEVAAAILETGETHRCDDATAVAVRLCPLSAPTQ